MALRVTYVVGGHVSSLTGFYLTAHSRVRPTCPGGAELLEGETPFHPLPAPEAADLEQLLRNVPLTEGIKSPSEKTQICKQMENRCLLARVCKLHWGHLGCVFH